MVRLKASGAAMPTAVRISRFSYAIRNIVVEAKKVEAAGRRVRYLNIGDPVAFGFHTPPHLIAAVERALRDGHNGYGPSPGIEPAREAVAAHSLDGAVDAYLAILSEAGRNGRDAQDGRDALASSRGSVSEWTRRSSSRS